MNTSAKSETNKPTSFCIAVALGTFILFRCIFSVVYVPTGSMEPTIPTGSLHIAYRLPFLMGWQADIDRGDIIVFSREGEYRLLCKRVIGLPDETIQIHDGKVYIDGNELKEEYLPVGTYTEGELEMMIPNDSYFVMGDNRGNSADSRQWDCRTVEYKKIYSRIVLKNFLGREQ